jgi:hypothetical protein
VLCPEQRTSDGALRRGVRHPDGRGGLATVGGPLERVQGRSDMNERLATEFLDRIVRKRGELRVDG